MKAVAIVNPVAGSRQARHLWPRLLQASGLTGSQVITWWTEGHRHAEILAARARRQGYPRVLAVGGDGTLLEVANGLWWEDRGSLPSLGVIPTGTGCDYVRNFNLGANPREHLATALGEATVPVNAGVFHCRRPGAAPIPRLFLNHLGLGFDATVIGNFQRWRLPLTGKLPYLAAGLRELLCLKYYHLQGTIDGEAFDATAFILVAGLGRSFGGGLKITPQASPQAQRFQVVWASRLGRLGLLGLLPRLWRGEHLQHPVVQMRWGRTVALRADPPMPVEAEGELVGETPLDAELYPGAFQIAARHCRSVWDPGLAAPPGQDETEP